MLDRGTGQVRDVLGEGGRVPSGPGAQMRRRAQQSGAALMALLAVLVLGSSWWLVTALNNPETRVPLETNHNARVLTQAKAALLGWVAHRALMAAEDHPGRLPCPEAAGWQNNHNGVSYIVDDDGIAAGSCTLPAVGRLPWRTLGLDRLTDAAGEPLWYVVSPGWAFAFPGDEPVINANTAGQLNLDGGAAVALIIAPGKALQVAAGGSCMARNQSRRRQPNVAWDLRDFLECENATSPADALFVSAGPANSVQRSRDRGDARGMCGCMPRGRSQRASSAMSCPPCSRSTPARNGELRRRTRCFLLPRRTLTRRCLLSRAWWTCAKVSCR